MRALTLTQPWAGLVASGIKRVENRLRPMIAKAHFGSVLRDESALPEPVPCKGALGFWAVPPDVEERVRAQLPGGHQ